MSASSEPFPIVLIGLHTEMGALVSRSLLPEYEVIRFIQSFEEAQADLPHLLAGREPPTPSTNDVGTHEYGRPARAVLFGRAFTPEQAAALKKSAAGSAKDAVVWVAGDPAGKPSGDGPPPGYEEVVAKTAKSIIGRWREEGAVRDETVLY
ncbi:hypothetical protein F5X99DRAFT_380545 [Biscogniauxia marginata]|nr:hypothetical protein F5X99DRAFT_380545 [Biscogniauxia marginata]